MSKKRLITFSDKMDEMIGDISRKIGVERFSEVVRLCVVSHHRQLFPTYKVTPSKNQDSNDNVDEELKPSSICELPYPDGLGGSFIDDGENPKCEYFTYNRKIRSQQTVPLHMVSKQLIKTQYQPSFEKVKQLQEEGKVDYL